MDVEALRSELTEIRNRVDRLLASLQVRDEHPSRHWRPYDDPTPDPIVIAERWGVVDPPDDTPAPAWFQERFGGHTEQPQ